MSNSKELESIYEKIGSGEEVTDAMLDRIKELKIIHSIQYEDDILKEIGCGCGHPTRCWDCTAIIGGCPADA